MTRNRTLVVTILRCSTLGLLISVFVAGDAAAQSLGEVARREQARRKSAPAGKVYTNESLPVVSTPPAPAAQQTGAAAAQADTPAAAPSTAAGAKPDETTKDEKYWRDRIKTAREALSRAESFAEALQSRINALSNDFVNRDDPAQRNAIAVDRDKALAELDRVRTEIKEHQKTIADTQEEARRAGVPAGWVR
ncbi:MAG TPA: hypothetical protein VFV95_07755 [Vicinamibacterales bacterium]|nr:hypothetical protein [Vicinamibacterales bacterium]